jgi:hypothetical protein
MSPTTLAISFLAIDPKAFGGPGDCENDLDDVIDLR